ncbi:MAG: aminopeptidase [Anaerolineales bacterium]|nr:aminopeptidase [Anaerolineales bacterium]
MPDPRVTKLAQVLVNYSLNIQPGDELAIMTTPVADELNLAILKEAVLAGAHVLTNSETIAADEFFLKYASDAQLDHVSPVFKMIAENYDAYIEIMAPTNTRGLSGVDPERMARKQRATAPYFQTAMQRAMRGEFKLCITLYPTNAGAQEADMSLTDYEDFVYTAGLLDLVDPVAAWKAEGERQEKLVRWLAGKDQVVMKGENIDLTLSIAERGFLKACGRENFPDGEIYTSPVETSVNGWVRFGYPAIYKGREVEDIELWLEDGKIVKETASKGLDFLTGLLNTDAASRYLGEWGIGTNYQIQKFTKNMLFDEKIGGTFHFAVGYGFPEAGGKTESGLHWDMLCNMADSEVSVDGELFYENGRFVIE